MLVERRVPPATAARCEEIHATGGLGPPPPGAMPDVLPPSGEASRDVLMHDASLGGRQDRCALHVPSLASHLAYLPPGCLLCTHHAPPSQAPPFLGQLERHAYCQGGRQYYLNSILPFVTTSRASLPCSAAEGSIAARQKKPTAGSPSSGNKQEGFLPGVKPAGRMFCPRPLSFAVHPAYRGVASISSCIDVRAGASLPGTWPGTGGSAWGAPRRAYVAMTWTGASSIMTPSASFGRNVHSAGWKARARCGGNSEPRPTPWPLMGSQSLTYQLAQTLHMHAWDV